MEEKWYKSKAVWTGVAGVIAGVGGYLTGEMELVAAVQTALGGLSVIFVRLGIMKVAK